VRRRDRRSAADHRSGHSESRTFFNFMSAFMKDDARIRVELVVTTWFLDLIRKISRRDPRRKLQDSNVVARRLGHKRLLPLWPLRNT